LGKRTPLLCLLAFALTGPAVIAEAQEQIKPRFVVVVDTSGSMLLTPEIVTHAGGGTSGVATRGDGSAEHPGCDVDGDGLANDSRIFQAKEALQTVFATFGEVEFALARFTQLGTISCTVDADCPTPGSAGFRPWSCEDGACQVAASLIGSDDGRCTQFGWRECDGTFDCDDCPAGGSRNTCNSFDLDDICEGGTSPIGSATVDCLSSPDDEFLSYLGGFNYGGGVLCDPLGGDVVVSFPATAEDDNYTELLSWIDHQQPLPFDGSAASLDDNELRALGGTPLAASLRDMEAFLAAGGGPLDTDGAVDCRRYSVILLTDGIESCETVQAARDAATSLQSVAVPGGGTIQVDTYVIGFAICPDSDPDCTTIQDLDSIAAAGGTTSAFRAANQLELQAALNQIVADSLVAERCNGLDDDCDTLIDEDFPNLGAGCSEGVGECLDTGVTVCRADELGTECSATPGTPGTEVCNDLDDDCNGLVDDGISCTPCTPQTETCNGVDDDCDSNVDEGFVSQPCGLDVGECEPGNTVCNGAGGVVCDGATGPEPEVCDGLDNDCNGISDGIAQTCYPAATDGCDLGAGTCVGQCQLGTEECPVGGGGVFGACVGAVTPVPEIACNGLDDDCDGLTDENTGDETCNGIDDDCDGDVDEDVAATDPTIGVDCGDPPFEGVCQPGTTICIAGSVECRGEIDPTTEICDTLDNDCDGTPDNNLPPPFGDSCGSDEGTCEAGTLECVNGAPSCEGDVGPTPEVCDGLDNNCNGATDETDPNIGAECNDLPGGGTVNTEEGECRFGRLACVAGDLECVGAQGPQDEACNVLDDDCDSAVDEAFPDLGDACDNGEVGVCRIGGVIVCRADGTGTRCTAPPGSGTDEICDGLDNDCDNEVDEGPPPPVGEVCQPPIGVCDPGLWECNDGVLECGAPGTGVPEVCNAEDDDCDGFVDESPVPGEGEICTDPGFEDEGDIGECEFGASACRNGTIVCEGYIGPTPEICDGLDNDCDGFADNEAECPSPDNVCFEGSCVIPCATSEFPCPTGFICRAIPDSPPPGQYCVPDPCADVTCEAGERCDTDTGECVGLCEGIECETGEVCRDGFCLDCSALPDLCEAGQACVDTNDDGVSECVDNPCDPNPCDDDEICSNGTCMPECDCAPGERCLEGMCVNDPCADVECRDTQVCDPTTGECASRECRAVNCPGDEICVEATGECIADPCSLNRCPDGTECVVDARGEFQCNAPAAPPGDRVAAAGGGCSTSGGDSTGLWILGLVALVRARRRRGRREVAR